ncbi:MAG TPA: ATP-grasp domain-containing protein [Bacteroidales bacterium]|nr:ATP-grasp domain-containing protein [Bacteroidales bacterium]
MNVALVYGGSSSEREISILSGKHVAQHLQAPDRHVFEVDLYNSRWNLVAVNGNAVPKTPIDKNDFTVHWEGEKISFHAVVLMVHGTPGEDGLFISYLQMLGIPHTGCSAKVALTAFDKYACKCVLRAQGVLMPKEIRVTKAMESSLWEDPVRWCKQAEKTIGPMPWFVKPASGGSSFGISRVHNPSDLLPAVERALEEDVVVLIEEYIEGVEVTNGYMKTKDREFILPVTEIVPHTPTGFFDYQAKYKGASSEITPARIPAHITKQIQDTTSFIYNTLMCKGVVRVDYILRGDSLFFLEVNTVPGMTTKSLVPQEIEAAGMTLREFLNYLLESALDDHKVF